MLRKLVVNIRDLTLTSVIFGSALYGYIYYCTKNNEQRYLQSVKQETLRDASRLSNDSFGISWGFQADDTIMSRMDSGDLLFIKYDCQECLTPSSMVNCYLKTSHYLDQQYHSIGTTYRDETNLYVYYNEFGETKARSYCEFVSKPYIKELTLQKRGQKYLQAHKNLKKEINFEKTIQQSSLNFASRLSRILGYSQIVKSIEDLLSSQQKINIRTLTNRQLSSL